MQIGTYRPIMRGSEAAITLASYASIVGAIPARATINTMTPNDKTFEEHQKFKAEWAPKEHRWQTEALDIAYSVWLEADKPLNIMLPLSCPTASKSRLMFALAVKRWSFIELGVYAMTSEQEPILTLKASCAIDSKYNWIYKPVVTAERNVVNF